MECGDGNEHDIRRKAEAPPGGDGTESDSAGRKARHDPAKDLLPGAGPI